MKEWHSAVAAIVAVTTWPCTVHAHRLALPFAFWGGFSSRAAHCQHVIAFAADRCARQMWKARSHCLSSLVDGGACEVTATDNAVLQAHLGALNLIDLECTSPEAQELAFLLKYEAQTDMDVFCHAVETALVSAVYLPATTYGVVRSVDSTTRTCIGAAQRSATHMLRFASHERRHALDRIAAMNLSPSEKQALVDQSDAHIERARIVLEGHVEETCPTFALVYHQSAGAFLQLIAERADCLAGATYVQNSVVCPSPTCGNGMQEPGEHCDDGNTLDGDECSSQCIIESP